MNTTRYPYGRPAEGSTIDVPPFGRCEVLAHTDPSIVRLRTTSGAEVKIGERALRLILAGEDARPTTTEAKR